MSIFYHFRAHWDVNLEKSKNQAKIIYQPNIHAISLIFGQWVAVCELLTYFDYFFHFACTLGCQIGKKPKNHAKIIYQSNIHTISLIFGVWEAVFKLLTYFHCFFHFAHTLCCKIQKSPKISQKLFTSLISMQFR